MQNAVSFKSESGALLIVFQDGTIGMYGKGEAEDNLHKDAVSRSDTDPDKKYREAREILNEIREIPPNEWLTEKAIGFVNKFFDLALAYQSVEDENLYTLPLMDSTVFSIGVSTGNAYLGYFQNAQYGLPISVLANFYEG